MKILIPLFLTFSFLSACTPSRGGGVIDYHTIGSIEASNSQGRHEKGVGYFLGSGVFLSSAHIRQDDQDIYTVRGARYYPVWDDLTRDLLIVADDPNATAPVLYFTPTETGASIIALLPREGGWISVTGSVLAPQATVMAYHRDGRVRILSGIVLTDLPIEEGDSGAPLFDLAGNLVDIVHVVSPE